MAAPIWILQPDAQGNCCDCTNRVEPCDSCEELCRSKTGILQLTTCTGSGTTFTVDETFPVGSQIVHIRFTFVATSNNNGTWTVTLTELTATHAGIPYTDPNLCGPWPVIPNQCVAFAPACVTGARWRVGTTATINDCSFFGGNPAWCFYSADNPTFFDFAAVVQANGWTNYFTLTTAVLNYFYNDAYPFDEIPNCESAYVGSVSNYSLGQLPFRYFQKKIVLDNLVIGQNYTLTVNWESRPYPSGGVFTPFSQTIINFEATSSHEITDWLDPLNNNIPISNIMDSKEVRMKNYTLSP